MGKADHQRVADIDAQAELIQRRLVAIAADLRHFEHPRPAVPDPDVEALSPPVPLRVHRREMWLRTLAEAGHDMRWTQAG